MTGPDVVISPLLTPCFGLGGDGFLGSFSPGVTNTFLDRQSSFPSPFLLVTPLQTALGVDEDAPSFPLAFSFFLHAAASLTYAHSLVASIFAKGQIVSIGTSDGLRQADRKRKKKD